MQGMVCNYVVQEVSQIEGQLETGSTMSHFYMIARYLGKEGRIST